MYRTGSNATLIVPRTFLGFGRRGGISSADFWPNTRKSSCIGNKWPKISTWMYYMKSRGGSHRCGKEGVEESL